MSSARDSADGTTSKGQVTIPKALRQQFGLARGSRVRFALVGDHIELRPWKPEPPVPQSGFGLLRSIRTAAALCDARASSIWRHGCLCRQVPDRGSKRSLSQQALADLEAAAGGDPRQRRLQVLQRIAEREAPQLDLSREESPEALIHADRERRWRRPACSTHPPSSA